MEIERLTARVEAETRRFERDIDRVDRKLDDAADDRQATLNVTVVGEEEAEAKIDTAARDRRSEIKVDFDLAGDDTTARLIDMTTGEILAKDIDVDIIFNPKNEGEAEAVLDFIGRDRIVNMDVDVDGAAEAEAELDAVSRDRKVELKVDVDRGFGRMLTPLMQHNGLNFLEGMWGKFLPSAEQLGDFKKFTKMVEDAGGIVQQFGGQASTTAGQTGELGGAFAKLGKITMPLLIAAFVALLPAIVSIGPAILALGGYVVGLVAAFAPLVGLLLTLPGLIMGVVGVMGVLALAFKDVIPAIQEEIQIRGRSPEEIAQAERDLASARTSLAQATQTKALADRAAAEAHRDAAEAIEDAQFAARQAQISEEQAVLGLERAYKRLNDIQAGIAGKTEEISKVTDDFTGKQFEVTRITYDAIDAKEDERDALLAVKQAELNLQQARDHREDTERNLRDLESRGIENSDIVVSALLAQEAATNALAAAQKALTDAREKAEGTNTELKDEQDSVVGFVQAIGDIYEQYIKPLMETLQDTLLPPLTEALKEMIPLFEQLAPILVPIAEGLGEMIKSFAQDFITQDNIDKMKEFGEGLGSFLADMGPILATFATAMLDMTIAAKPVLDAFGDILDDISERFANFASGDGTSGGKTIDWWFQKTADVLKITFDLIGNLIGAMAGLIVAMEPFTTWILDGLTEGSQRMEDFTNSAEGQEKIANFFERMKAPLATFADLLGAIAVGFVQVFGSQEAMDMFDHFLTVTKDQTLPAILGLFDMMIKSGFLDGIIDVVGAFINLAGVMANFGFGDAEDSFSLLAGVLEAVALLLNSIAGIMQGFDGVFDWVSDLLHLSEAMDQLEQWFDDLWTNIKGWFAEWDWAVIWDGMILAALTAFDGIANGFISVINWMLEHWNKVELTIPGFGGVKDPAFGITLVPGWDPFTLSFGNPMAIPEITARSDLAGAYQNRIDQREADKLRDSTNENGVPYYLQPRDLNVGDAAIGPTLPSVNITQNFNVPAGTDTYGVAQESTWQLDSTFRRYGSSLVPGNVR